MNNPHRCSVGLLFFSILSITSTSFFLVGCNWQQSVKGKGEQISANADLEPFSRFSIEIPGNVQVVPSDRFHYEIEGYENIIPIVEFIIVNDRLQINSTRKIGSASRIILQMPQNTLAEVAIAGSATIEVRMPVHKEDFTAKIAGSGSLQIELEAQTLNTKLAGSGTATYRGSAERHNINIAGSGTVQADFLDSHWAQVKIAGSGDAWVKVSRQLFANIVGSGNVYLSGNPDIDSSTLGSGKVIPTEVAK
jgi:hypothetical protein